MTPGISLKDATIAADNGQLPYGPGDAGGTVALTSKPVSAASRDGVKREGMLKTWSWQVASPTGFETCGQGPLIGGLLAAA